MATDVSSSHSRAWKAYYDALSIMIQHDIVQPVFKSRLQQSAELRKVEAVYQGILLREIQFPKANQANSLIEDWVDQVMVNWRVMCGGSWKDEDLGDGGKTSLCRSVLEVCLVLSFPTAAFLY